MIDFVSFISQVLSCVSSFLTSEPIIYFVGLSILAYIVGILSSFMKSSIKRI